LRLSDHHITALLLHSFRAIIHSLSFLELARCLVILLLVTIHTTFQMLAVVPSYGAQQRLQVNNIGLLMLLYGQS